jgi:hypothetical protein
MTVGILMLHCGQGIRNTDTYTPEKFKTYLLNGNILFSHLNLILMLRKHWHHCFLAEFSKDDPDFFKEASWQSMIGNSNVPTNIT